MITYAINLLVLLKYYFNFQQINHYQIFYIHHYQIHYQIHEQIH